MSRANVNANETYAAIFTHFDFLLPGQCVLDCSRAGSVDEDVAYWADEIPCPLHNDDVRNMLSEYGCWDKSELADADANWQRLLWIAACNIAEEA